MEPQRKHSAALHTCYPCRRTIPRHNSNNISSSHRRRRSRLHVGHHNVPPVQPDSPDRVP
ncbi:BnaA01g13590D [Brassica napus]|uniref:BnaA01g13590D protein n=1 Tax=Brassica napus TaxID=3708 RepID=A0A078ICM2_BRANA|nr:BnaA01g13590D [Brassica napus]